MPLEQTRPRARVGGAGTEVIGAEASRADPLVVEVLTGDASIVEHVFDEWSELCDEGASDPLFHRPEWFAAFLRCFEPGAALVLLTARRRGRLRGILPLIAERGTMYGLPVRRLRAPVNSHSCRFDVSCGVGESSRVARALWAHLRDRPGWDVLELRDVPPGSVIGEVAALAEREEWPVGHWESMQTPYVPLGGATERPVGGPDAKFRANLRRRERNLEAEGPLRLRLVEQADRAVLGELYAMERSGWKGREGSAIACSPDTRRFYDELARAAARLGRLSIYVLEHAGRPIAMHFGVCSRTRYFLNKPAYDEGFARHSPGQLLLAKVLEDCARRGLVELDFLGAWMPWKGEWTALSRRHEVCWIFREGLYGSILRAAKVEVAPRLKARAPLHLFARFSPRSRVGTAHAEQEAPPRRARGRGLVRRV